MLVRSLISIPVMTRPNKLNTVNRTNQAMPSSFCGEYKKSELKKSGYDYPFEFSQYYQIGEGCYHKFFDEYIERYNNLENDPKKLRATINKDAIEALDDDSTKGYCRKVAFLRCIVHYTVPAHVKKIAENWNEKYTKKYNDNQEFKYDPKNKITDDLRSIYEIKRDTQTILDFRNKYCYPDKAFENNQSYQRCEKIIRNTYDKFLDNPEKLEKTINDDAENCFDTKTFMYAFIRNVGDYTSDKHVKEIAKKWLNTPDREKAVGNTLERMLGTK